MLRIAAISIALSSNIAWAQAGVVGTATHHLTMREVDTVTLLPVANPDGMIGPGEAALISLSISFTPPVGTLLPPPHASGTAIAALRGGLVEVHAAGGSWHNWSLREGWNNPPYAPGHAVANYIGEIIIQQPAIGAETSNPVEDIWQGYWRPFTYTNLTVPFSTWHWGISSNTALWLNDPGPPQQYLYGQAHTTFAYMPIQVIPAPGAGAILAMCLAAGGVRRRRSSRRSPTR